MLMISILECVDSDELQLEFFPVFSAPDVVSI